MLNIYEFLDNNNITYERFDHEAAFTCEQAEKVCPKMPGVSIKNLFLLSVLRLQNGSKIALELNQDQLPY